MLNIEEWVRNNPVPAQRAYKESATNDFELFEELVELLGTLLGNHEPSVLNKYHDVMSSHISKEILLPVLRFKINNSVVLIRGNLMNYEIQVASDKTVKLDCFELFDPNMTAYAFEGIPEGLKQRTPYSKDKEHFSVMVDGSRYECFAVMYQILSSIIKR